ncbi:MAG: hypothetical protein LBQ57_04005 [Spirochaetales bacterium]|nr:hypothetical protein [Spirochaetales bacterium]
MPWTDPGLNLAAEEYLLDESRAAEAGPVLLVYENSEAIVIGKNQNPWREIAPSVLRGGSPRFFRRISGGGTVWHGPGNLNFSFIMPRGGFCKEENLDFVRRAVARLGVNPDRTARGDLVAGGGKVSGNALCYRKDRALHHGTLLVCARLDRLKSCLPDAEGPRLRISTRAIASVSMPVANLADFAAGIACRSLAQALLDEARDVYASVSAPAGTEDFLPQARLREIAALRDTWQWRYGMTPAFCCQIGEKTFTVQDGIVVSAAPAGDDRVGLRFDPDLLCS